MNTRSDLYRQRQAMRQRIRALVVARRIAAAVLTEVDVTGSPDEPTP